MAGLGYFITRAFFTAGFLEQPYTVFDYSRETEMATARLRKTFQYPTDNDSEDEGPEAMDEEGMIIPQGRFSAFSPPTLQPLIHLSKIPYITQEAH